MLDLKETLRNEEDTISTPSSEICGKWENELNPCSENSAREGVELRRVFTEMVELAVRSLMSALSQSSMFLEKHFGFS